MLISEGRVQDGMIYLSKALRNKFMSQFEQTVTRADRVLFLR
jgi:hypothetical protein